MIASYIRHFVFASRPVVVESRTVLPQIVNNHWCGDVCAQHILYYYVN